MMGVEPRGVLLRQDVIPLVSVAVALAALLTWWIRVGTARHWAETAARGAGSASPPTFERLIRHVLTTAAGGYVAFLMIVGFYYLVLGGQTRSFLVDALWGGAFLAFGVAVPVFLLAGTLGRSRPANRRR